MFFHILIMTNLLPSLLLCEPSSSRSRNMLLNGKECLEAPFRSGHCEKPEVAWSFDPARKKCQSFQV